MILKTGQKYKISVDPANFLVESFIDENYAVVSFADNNCFRLSQITMLENLNGKVCKYLGSPYAPPSSDLALVEVETKFGPVKMILMINDLVPLIVVTPSNTPICVCATQVIMTIGCQCGSFKKEQALKASLVSSKN